MSSFSHRSRRLIFSDFDGAEGEVRQYAASFSWPVVRETADDIERGTLGEVVWSIAPTVELAFSVDDATGCPFVFVSAAYRNQCHAFLAHAELHLDVWPREELVSLYDQAVHPQERAARLLVMAIGSPQEFDEIGMARIISALRDPDDTVRASAIYATSYTPAEAYVPLLRNIARRDPNRRLRRDAKKMLAAYEEVGIGPAHAQD